MPPSPEQLEIARLQARVAALEAAVERRSQVLRRFQELACLRDLAVLGRLEAGLPPLPRFATDLDLWVETVEPVHADVDEILTDLWLSATPPAAPTREADDR
jgi:hypothetical protein